MNTKNIYQDYSDNKKSLTKNILKQFNKKSLEYQFINVYFEATSGKSLQNETTTSFKSFLINRYNYMMKFLSSSKESSLHISPLNNQKENTSYSLEIVTKDYQYLIFTIENIFHSHNINITKRYHPLFAVKCDKKNSVTSISLPNKDDQLFSSIYIEFELDESSELVQQLQAEIMDKIQALKLLNQDKSKILGHVKFIQEEVKQNPTPVKEFHTEWIELLDWLLNGNFTFLGCVEYKFSKSGKPIPDKKTGLGLFSPELKSNLYKELVHTTTAEVIRLKDYRSPFIFDRIQYISPVKSFEKVMRLSLKIKKSDNHIIEYNIVGLLRRMSLLSRNINTPIIKQKMNTILAKKQFLEGTYNYNQVMRFLNKTPKFELFRTPTENLQELIENLLSITNFSDLYLFTRRRIDQSKLFLLVVLPKNLYDHNTISKIVSFLSQEIPNTGVEYISIDSDSFGRLHIYFNLKNDTHWQPNLLDLESSLKELVLSWDDQLKSLLKRTFSPSQGLKYYNKYSTCIPKTS